MPVVQLCHSDSELDSKVSVLVDRYGTCRRSARGKKSRQQTRPATSVIYENIQRARLVMGRYSRPKQPQSLASRDRETGRVFLKNRRTTRECTPLSVLPRSNASAHPVCFLEPGEPYMYIFSAGIPSSRALSQHCTDLRW